MILVEKTRDGCHISGRYEQRRCVIEYVDPRNGERPGVNVRAVIDCADYTAVVPFKDGSFGILNRAEYLIVKEGW